MNVLAEGWDGGELANEVEVGGDKGMNSTAVINRQSLVGGQSQILERKQRHRTVKHPTSEGFVLIL